MENATKLKVPFEQEMLLVLFHGVLHLVGYKDKTVAQKEVMRKMEERWIRGYEKFK